MFKHSSTLSFLFLVLVITACAPKIPGLPRHPREPNTAKSIRQAKASFPMAASSGPQAKVYSLLLTLTAWCSHPMAK